MKDINKYHTGLTRVHIDEMRAYMKPIVEEVRKLQRPWGNDITDADPLLVDAVNLADSYETLNKYIDQQQKLLLILEKATLEILSDHIVRQEIDEMEREDYKWLIGERDET